MREGSTYPWRWPHKNNLETLLQQLQYEEVPASLQEIRPTKLAVHKQSKICNSIFEMPQLPSAEMAGCLAARCRRRLSQYCANNLSASFNWTTNGTNARGLLTWVLQQHQTNRVLSGVCTCVAKSLATTRLNGSIPLFGPTMRQTGLPIIEGTLKS